MNRLDLINRLRKENPELTITEILRLYPAGVSDRIRDGIDVDREQIQAGRATRWEKPKENKS